MNLEIPTLETLMPIALGLIVSDRMLTNKEIKFLRSTFDVSQKDLCHAIDIKQTSYYSRCEAGKLNFSPDKMVRIKLFFACKAKVEGCENYALINRTR